MNRNNRWLVTAEVMSHLDAATISEIGIPGEVLMENAGQKCWRQLRVRLPRPEGVQVVFVAGNGNNGGDALVMARQCLIEGVNHPRVVTLRRNLKGTALTQWEYLRRLDLERLVWEDEPEAVTDLLQALTEGDAVVDGITGTGTNGPLREPEAILVSRIQHSSAIVYAVDVPSGMRDAGKIDEIVVRADVTICTGYRKRCLYAPVRRENAGEILQVDPGFPDLEVFADASWYPSSRTALFADSDVESVRPMLSDLPAGAHKGSRGRLLVIAGGDGTEGAALLAAESAGTTGAGMVSVVTTPGAAAAGIAREPGVMWRSYPPENQEIAWADALVIGPGWVGGSPDKLQRILAAVHTPGDEKVRPVLLDAAALRIITSSSGSSWTDLPDPGVPIIMTPHPGEMAALAGTSVDDILTNPFEILETVFRPITWLQGVTVVLKGSVTIIRTADGDFFVVDGRCPSLGVAGSGDVLSGILGARLAGATACAGRNTTPRGAFFGSSRLPVNSGSPSSDPIVSAVLHGVAEHLRRGRLLARQFGAYTAGTLARTSLPPNNDNVYGKYR